MRFRARVRASQMRAGGLHRLALLVLALALVATVCAAPPAVASAKKKAEPVVAKKKASPGGTVTFAFQPTDEFSWMLPLENGANEEPWELSTDECLWLPLYFEGKGSDPVIDYARSLADPPVYSDGDRTITIKLRHYVWSDGEPVTTRDIQFFFNIYKAGESKIATYVPGEFPDNITRVDYPSATTFVIHLDRSYSEQWYTDNQLVNIVPMPQQSWDRESTGGPVGSFDLTSAGATKVFNFLYGQSEQLSSYASNPLWKVVDGPFTVTSYDSVTGRTELTPNNSYDGPDRARLAHVILEDFPSAAAEVDALRSGEVDYGYIPYSDYGLVGYFQSHGYTVAPWAPDYEQSVEVGFTSKVYGPLVDQLYIRQALQHLVNENLYLKTTLDGVGQLTYGPVPNIPGSPYVSPAEHHDPYPYSIAAARSLLGAHGWKAGANGVMVCERPGTKANECGARIDKGRSLTLAVELHHHRSRRARLAGGGVPDGGEVGGDPDQPRPAERDDPVLARRRLPAGTMQLRARALPPVVHRLRGPRDPADARAAVRQGQLLRRGLLLADRAAADRGCRGALGVELPLPVGELHRDERGGDLVADRRQPDLRRLGPPQGMVAPAGFREHHPERVVLPVVGRTADDSTARRRAVVRAPAGCPRRGDARTLRR